jgi:hypothetical protein
MRLAFISDARLRSIAIHLNTSGTLPKLHPSPPMLPAARTL